MDKTGIWIDAKTAYIIDPEKGIVSSVQSNIEDFHPAGGARGNSPFSSQDAIKDTQLLERKKHQIKSFCCEVMNHIDPQSELVIFGPAQMKIELEKALKESDEFKSIVTDIQPADSMSENQLQEWVRNYYNK